MSVPFSLCVSQNAMFHFHGFFFFVTNSLDQWACNWKWYTYVIQALCSFNASNHSLYLLTHQLCCWPGLWLFPLKIYVCTDGYLLLLKLGTRDVMEGWGQDYSCRIWPRSALKTRPSRPIRCAVWIVEQMCYRPTNQRAQPHLKIWRKKHEGTISLDPSLAVIPHSWVRFIGVYRWLFLNSYYYLGNKFSIKFSRE